MIQTCSKLRQSLRSAVTAAARTRASTPTTG